MSETVRSATHALMRDLGMTTIFGNPGSTELRFFRDAPADFRYVLALQESSAVAMADGYAQATRNAAFVNLHSAVGVGHALGSIFTAMRNQTPLVITAGQQSRRAAHRGAVPLLRAGNRAAEAVREVERRAGSGRRRACRDRPLVLHGDAGAAGPDVRLDPRGRLGCRRGDRSPAARSRGDFVGEPEALGAVAAALNDSARPALVVGAGVDRDGAFDLVVALAERIGATVWVSPLVGPVQLSGGPSRVRGLPHAGARPAFRAARARTMSWSCSARPCSPTTCVPRATSIADGTALFLLTDDPDAAAFAPVGAAVVTTLRRGIADLLGARHRVGPRACGPQAASHPAR